MITAPRASKVQAPPITPPLSSGAVIFGVRYVWANPSKRGSELVGEGLRPIYRALWEHAGKYLPRQKRDVLTYWDGLTFLQGQGAGMCVKKAEPETLLCLRLLSQFADQRLEFDDVWELAHLPALEHFKSRLVYHRADGYDPEAAALGRADPASLERTIHNTWRAKRGFHREFHVDAKAVEGPMTKASWTRLFVLAILAQLRADLEIFYETGFFRIRRCERRACMAWFAAKAMGSGKQRFCCGGCRASFVREGNHRR